MRSCQQKEKYLKSNRDQRMSSVPEYVNQHKGSTTLRLPRTITQPDIVDSVSPHVLCKGKWCILRYGYYNWNHNITASLFTMLQMYISWIRKIPCMIYWKGTYSYLTYKLYLAAMLWIRYYTTSVHQCYNTNLELWQPGNRLIHCLWP